MLFTNELAKQSFSQMPSRQKNNKARVTQHSIPLRRYYWKYKTTEQIATTIHSLLFKDIDETASFLIQNIARVNNAICSKPATVPAI